MPYDLTDAKITYANDDISDSQQINKLNEYEYVLYQALITPDRLRYQGESPPDGTVLLDAN